MNVLKLLQNSIRLELDEDEERGVLKILGSMASGYLIVNEGMIREAYDYKRNAKQALVEAIESRQDQERWETAYLMAHEADRLGFPLLESQFYDNILCGMTGLWHIGFFIMLFYGALCDSETLPVAVKYFIILGVAGYIQHGLSIPVRLPFDKQIIERLMPHLTDNVRDEAHKAGVTLRTIELQDDSASLMSNIMNTVNYEDELSGSDDIPHSMCCPLTRTIMIDPVTIKNQIRDENRPRFERAALLEWLQRKPVNIFTSKPLFSNELIRDFEFKRTIHNYVAEKLLQKGVHQFKNKSSVRLSMFQPGPKQTDKDECITGQMIAESTPESGFAGA